MSPCREELRPGVVAELATLHACRTDADLDRALDRFLARWVPDADCGLYLRTDGAPTCQLRFARDDGTFPAAVDPDAWTQGGCLPIDYGDHRIGVLLTAAPVTAECAGLLATALSHYGVALVNLTLNSESRRATAHYCATLQAFEEGIVLFQERDPMAITARLLTLAAAMAHAPAAALYVLDEVGHPDSPLRLLQVFGLPEQLLATLDDRDGASWPRRLLTNPAFFAVRAEDPTLGGFDPARLPAALANLVSLPLRYVGVDAGLCVLFNVADDADDRQDQLDRLGSLGQLGAALLHRLHLEAISATQRSIERELQIASDIQRRLLPQRPPPTDRFDCAWKSESAKSIGGDYLDLVVDDHGLLHAVIADAAGHGIDSALLMSSFRSTYRVMAPTTEPAGLCTALNAEVLGEVGQTGKFITAAVLRLDADRRSLRIANAGHNAVLLYRRATGAVTAFAAHGPPLGFCADPEYASEQHPLDSGDVLLLYTDGIAEATDPELEMFGDDRVAAALQRLASRPAAAILQALLDELTHFTGRERYDDDVSVSIVKVR